MQHHSAPSDRDVHGKNTYRDAGCAASRLAETDKVPARSSGTIDRPCQTDCLICVLHVVSDPPA
jgi:hypothetical protein